MDDRSRYQDLMDGTALEQSSPSEDYARIERAILFLEHNANRQPSLSEVASSAGLSEYHFQRLFSRWVGISPKRFLQFLTKEYAKQLLARSRNVLEVTYTVGLSSPSRLHDLFVTYEAVTPGEYKSRGEGLQITYGFHPSPFGECLVGMTARGVCALQFVMEGDRTASLHELQSRWERSNLEENEEATRPVATTIFDGLDDFHWNGLKLHVAGTNFQMKVWEALLRIPAGSLVSYEDIAHAIGRENSQRAVGAAVGANPVPVLIPCHRVIHKMGDLGRYHYGSARKKALIGWEAAHPL